MSHAHSHSACSRRSFIAGCAACCGCAAGASLLNVATAATEGSATAGSAGGKAKVRLVFCETPNDKPIWPNIGYDFDARRNQILAALGKGCSDVEFVVSKLNNKPEETAALLKDETPVDGYLICVQGLGWANDIHKLSATGKPSLVVDNLFGGSGKFLTQLPAIMKSGKPVDWVSSSNDEDIVASAREFALVKQGKSAADVAAAFRAARRKNTPTAGDWKCPDDPLPTVNFDEALKRIRQTKILFVGRGEGADPIRKGAAEVFGTDLMPIKFEELAAGYEAVEAEAAEAMAAKWLAKAAKVVEPSKAEIQQSARMYLAMKQLIEKHGATGISVNCLGGFYGGFLKAYPCLGFAQLNDDGLVGGCEGDQKSALTMSIMGSLVGRPGFISDPVIDTAKNQIIYAHCVAMTKPFGKAGKANPYHIRNHSEDRKGAAVQSMLPEGYMTTTMQIDPAAKQVIVHRAKSAGNHPSDMACRTKLQAVVKGDLEKLTESWRMGWHRVTFYGDLHDCVTELCQRTKLELIEEA